jgi:hypothetical protein
MVNANLFSIKHPFTWHRRRFIAVSPIKKRILKCMYICTFVYICIHSMYIWFKYFCLANANTRKTKAKATFYDLCVLRNFESTEQYFSAKWVIIFAPTVVQKFNTRGLALGKIKLISLLYKVHRKNIKTIKIFFISNIQYNNFAFSFLTIKSSRATKQHFYYQIP